MTTAKYELFVPVPEVFDCYDVSSDETFVFDERTQKTGWSDNGLMNLMECHNIKAFKVFGDDEVASILAQKSNDIDVNFISSKENDMLWP